MVKSLPTLDLDSEDDDDDDEGADEDQSREVIAALAHLLDKLRASGKARPTYQKVKARLAGAYGDSAVAAVKKQVPETHS